MTCGVETATDKRLRKLLEVARAYANRKALFAEVESALHEADRTATEAGELARADVWTLFEGRRAGDAAALSRIARTTTGAIRWALGIGGTPPPIPVSWNWAKKSLADAATPPVCEPAWQTPDVLALARLVQSGGTDALPILADALQDAGCEDERILDHGRDHGPHCAVCWVPDLILDNE
jgi:hypothetical protein